MTIDWLEEIAQWADGDAERSREQGRPDVAAIYADLARCARAWATMEKLGGKLWSVDQYNQCIRFGQGLNGYSDQFSTALKAVEAAGGGK